MLQKMLFAILFLFFVSNVIAQETKVLGHVQLYDSKGKIIENASGVVAFIEGKFDLPAKNVAPVKMSHQNKQFSPRVLPLKKGDAVDFFNDDGIYHNVFSLSKVKPFDLGIYPEGTSKIVPFNDTGLVKIYCNLHPKMISNILVLNNDFYALTDESGQFEITGLPIGNYTIRFWHELTKESSLNITINEGENRLGKVSLTIAKKIVQHKNKFGKRYKSKY